MATKRQLFEERLESVGFTWEQIEGMTKPEVQAEYDKHVPRGTIEEQGDLSPEEIETNSIVDELHKELGEYQEATEINPGTNQQPQEKNKPKRKRKSKFDQKTIVSGYMMLMIIDLVFPNVVVLLYKKLKGDTNITASDMQLTLDQKEELQPLADEAAKTLNVEVNPMYLFLISLGTYYTANFFALTGGFQIPKK
jgi:hypothetical protein